MPPSPCLCPLLLDILIPSSFPSHKVSEGINNKGRNAPEDKGGDKEAIINNCDKWRNYFLLFPPGWFDSQKEIYPHLSSIFMGNRIERY